MGRSEHGDPQHPLSGLAVPPIGECQIRATEAQGAVWGFWKLMPTSSASRCWLLFTSLCYSSLGTTGRTVPRCAVPSVPLLRQTPPECLASQFGGAVGAHSEACSWELPSSTSAFPASGFLWESGPGPRLSTSWRASLSLLGLPSILTTGLALQRIKKWTGFLRVRKTASEPGS